MFKRKCVLCGLSATYELKSKESGTALYYVCTEHMKIAINDFEATRLSNSRQSFVKDIIKELRTW